MRIQRSLAFTLALGLMPAMAQAFDFRDSDTGIEALVDIEVAYGLRLRTENTDQKLVSPAHGGDRVSAGRSGNLDDGNLNYDKGDLASNMFRATGELTLAWKNFGAFVRGYAFYDYENEDNDRQRTELTNEGLDQVGRDTQILDAYLSARFSVADNYDKDGQLWRVSEGHMVNFYEVPVPWYSLRVYYDLKQQRYLVEGLDNQRDPPEFDQEINPRLFGPNALDYYIR
jgi:hypothetical protein